MSVVGAIQCQLCARYLLQVNTIVHNGGVRFRIPAHAFDKIAPSKVVSHQNRVAGAFVQSYKMHNGFLTPQLVEDSGFPPETVEIDTDVPSRENFTAGGGVDPLHAVHRAKGTIVNDLGIREHKLNKDK